MPELPEVEEVRRTLEPFLLNIPIRAIKIIRQDFLTPPRAPIHNLRHQSITATLRHGKKLFLIAPDSQTLVLHLGMSGRVDCVPSPHPVPKHTHIILSLSTGTDVRLRDPRRFGGLAYYSTLAAAQSEQLACLGPDALSLTPAHLAHWKTTKAAIKQRLLSQKDVAGLGNIYVDEALWAAQIHPQQRLHRLTTEKIESLVSAILQVLHDSITSGGTTLRDYRNVTDQPGTFARQLKAYGRAAQPCLRCQTPLKSMLITARTTVFCPQCQRIK